MSKDTQCAESDLSTRERILIEAERLFTKKGFDDTSIRDITEGAGVNVAAINYHFGGKENLYTEIVGALAERVHSVRMERLEALLGEPPRVENVLRAFVETHLIHMAGLGRGNSDLALIYREISSPGPAFEIIFTKMILPTHGIFVQNIKRLMPELEEEQIRMCLFSLMGQIIHFIRANRVIVRLTDMEYTEEDLEKIADHIVCFSMGGLLRCGGAG